MSEIPNGGAAVGSAFAGSAFGRVFLTLLTVGVACTGIAYAGFLAFVCLIDYDDEGVVLLFVQHMLDGRAIYDQIDCLYGPFWVFARWVVFGVLHVPLGNDALRAETLVTWLATALLFSTTSWRLACGYACRAGIAALMGILSLCQLFVLPREPGHPQELVVLLVAAALYVAATMADRSRRISLLLLGAVAAAMVLTKVNVGVFYLVALTVSLLALTSRPWFVWFPLRCAAAVATLILPFMLMKSRFQDGYGGFCFVTTAAVLPCLVCACFKMRSGTLRIGDWLWCALGACLLTVPMLIFTVWQGNSLWGMVNAVSLRTFRNFASAPIGTPMPISMPEMAWATAATGVGLFSLWANRPSRLLLTTLRLFAGVAILLIAASRSYWIFAPFALAMPLVWLLLVPPRGHETSEANWFFRLFLAFTACLQPLQIFPVCGSQMLIGTAALPIVGLVLTLDVYEDVRDLAATRPFLFASLVPVLKRLAVILTAVASMRPRTYEILGGSWTLPSVTSTWAFLAAAMGLLVLQFEPSLRRFLWPLKLLLCVVIAAEILIFTAWDMTWVRFALPLSWLLLVPSPSQGIGVTGIYARLGLVVAGSLELWQAIPVFSLAGRPFHLGVFLMVAIGGLLLVDTVWDLGLAARFRSTKRAPLLSMNVLLLVVAFLIGSLSMIDSVEEYRRLTPLDLSGCRWTRMPERQATFCTFLATNARRSTDCVFARYGLESLHLWAEQRPASDVVPISNLWAQMDPDLDERLLRAHRDCLRMLFIDNPNPWNPVPPKLNFLDFIANQFQLLGRVGPTKLFVRKERSDLELFDCAFQRAVADGGAPNPTLELRLPRDPKLKRVAVVQLVDLTRDPGVDVLAATVDRGSQQLTLIDRAGSSLLPTEANPIELAESAASLRLTLPAGIELKGAGFPALRFLDPDGRRLLTIPVLTDVVQTVR
jgi:hypothetical protein